MITIVLFLLGLVMLLMKKYAGVITIIVVLASTYLQMNITEDIGILRVPGYEVSDFGLILYILLFFKTLNRRGAKWRGKIQDAVSIFLIFIVLNGVYDFFVGADMGDIVRYCRKWMYLTIVYIYPFFSPQCILKSFRQTYYITLFFCLTILLCRLFDTDLNIFKSIYGRGIKPPSFSIIFVVATLIDFFKMSSIKRILHFVVLLIPMILNLKMTYLVSVCLIYVLYILFQPKVRFYKKMWLYVLVGLSVFIIMSVSSQLKVRITAVINNRELIYKDDESYNFIYRLFHANERWNYIAENPTTLLRGIGYVQEKNFNKAIFEFGTTKKDKQDVAQLDTGDIAWSLFFIRLGMLGLLLYIVMYVKVTRSFFQYRKNPLSCFMFALMSVFLCFTSFGNTIIAESDFFIYPFLMLNNRGQELFVKKN